jgi:hypothetical protein
MFHLKFGNEIVQVSKIPVTEFSAHHQEVCSTLRWKDGHLVLSDARWRSTFLGAGEEKAVYCLCDHNTRVFALEVLDERTYRNGRFVNGTYFYDAYAEGLSRVKLYPKAVMGLMFTGRIKAREYVYGYEWARFHYQPDSEHPLDGLLTSTLHYRLAAQFAVLQNLYQDVHEGNVLFELRETHERGIRIPVRDWSGRLRIVKVGLQPIDVR